MVGKVEKMIGVVILNYNTSGDCIRCVDLIKKQNYNLYEVIIVDNCSCERDLKILREYCKKNTITLLLSSENRGYSAGNNIGLRYSLAKGYEYALVLNPDVELTNTEYISRILTKIESDMQIAVLGTDIVNRYGVHQNPMHNVSYFEEISVIYEVVYRKVRELFRKCFPEGDKYCSQLSGCCLLLRLSFVKGIGYFDEGVFLYCEEDILSKQVLKGGCVMYYMSGISAFHNHVTSQKYNLKERLQLLYDSRDYYRKNYCDCSELSLKILTKFRGVL